MGSLTPAELATIRGRLETFADDLLASLARADQRARGQCYLRGLLLDGRRKSIEPTAARLGEVHDQALHHFVAASPWDWRPVRRWLAEVLCGPLSPTAWVADDTGFPKDEVGGFRGGLDARQVPTWWRSAPTPAPTPSRCIPPPRRIRARAAVPGRATITSRPRSRSRPWRPGSRPAWT